MLHLIYLILKKKQKKKHFTSGLLKWLEPPPQLLKSASQRLGPIVGRWIQTPLQTPWLRETEGSWMTKCLCNPVQSETRKIWQRAWRSNNWLRVIITTISVPWSRWPVSTCCVGRNRMLKRLWSLPRAAVWCTAAQRTCHAEAWNP